MVQLSNAAENWLHNTVLINVGVAEMSEMERIFQLLIVADAPKELVHDYDNAVGAYLVRVTEAAFCAGIELAGDPIGYLVYGYQWEGPNNETECAADVPD